MSWYKAHETTTQYKKGYGCSRLSMFYYVITDNGFHDKVTMCQLIEILNEYWKRSCKISFINLILGIEKQFLQLLLPIYISFSCLVNGFATFKKWDEADLPNAMLMLTREPKVCVKPSKLAKYAPIGNSPS